MRVTIMQPAYLPWLGYIQRAMHSDVHVVLDHVKIDWHSKTQFANRNRILTANGPAWLTIPLSKKDSGNMVISDICISEREPWKRKHWMTMTQSYARAAHFTEHLEFFDTFYKIKHDRLVRALSTSSEYILQVFGCNSKIVSSASLNVEGQKDELVLNICKALGADIYLSGPFGRNYLNLAAFHQAGVKVLFHDFTPFPYLQTQPGFVPFLSGVDLLFNVGAQRAHELLSSSITLSEQ